MSNATEKHPLETDKERFGIKKPEARFDLQGDMSDEERLQTAMENFAKDINRRTATYMEACMHCGVCAEACHYYIQTEDPKYTPIWKLEVFKQAYKRESSPFAPLYRMFNLKKPVTTEQLEEWQELLYDSCTMCGRCSLVCPMCIDIATLVGQARHGMFKAGLVPHELHAVAERAEIEGSPLGATADKFEDRADWMCDEFDTELRFDEDEADILVTMSSIEIMKYPHAMGATARILNALGESWTFRGDGYEATNFGMLSGNVDWQRDMTMKLIDAAIKCNAKLVLLPECGHAYGALRWQGAAMLGKPLPFKVMHISEYLADAIESGRLQLEKVADSDKTFTFHDPCQVSRRGGATAAPRKIMDALGINWTEMSPAADDNWCCGGGGGVVTIHRADELRYKVFELKMEQV
ncbi:MAG: (Fe-S)-binding protein, partial [Woeseiaceae bacterium]|nr:(Fe-S)-binding protein [Woeseiaceae bacterium]